jgi:NADH:ubiquinone oxidoreductase subunit F (NADH-binding)
MAEKICARVANSHTAGVPRRGGYAGGTRPTDGAGGHHREVKKANLRGLGGAGFPTGVKWGFIPKGSTAPKYLVVNADEGEPGTFKDRYLLEQDPHALIEGMLISARAIDSHLGFVYVRGEYVQPWRIFSAAVREAYDAGLLGKNIQGTGFDFDASSSPRRGRLHLRRGDRSAVLARGRIRPKIKPPFPAIRGALGSHHRQQRRDAAAVPHRHRSGSGSPGSGPSRGRHADLLGGRVVRWASSRPRCRSRCAR